MRCALTISYNGTDFLGSQTQTQTSNTVLGTIGAVLSQLGINTKIIASGRTDKGVHATGQVCHIDLPSFWDNLTKLQKVLNQMLPNSIKVNSIKKVNQNFHARYDARKRVYRYLIKNEISNPFEEHFITFTEIESFENLKSNIKLFQGEHNFKYFMKTGSDVHSTTRIIYKAFAYIHKNTIVLNFEANGFLRSQIRLMVGALLQLDAKEIQEQLSGSTLHKVKPAPSNGLYLAKIKY